MKLYCNETYLTRLQHMRDALKSSRRRSPAASVSDIVHLSQARVEWGQDPATIGTRNNELSAEQREVLLIDSRSWRKGETWTPLSPTESGHPLDSMKRRVD
jgi:hypothetical protein